jgi:hypothetical protein
MQRIRATVAGSLKKTMPKTAAPTAPIPVQTAYAVPSGRDFIATPSSQKLSQAATNVTPVYRCLVNPSEAFMLLDQTISSRPAISSIAQAVDAAEIEAIGICALWRGDVREVLVCAASYIESSQPAGRAYAREQ